MDRPRLRVAWDYFVFPVWVEEDQDEGWVQKDDAPVSGDLRLRLAAWADEQTEAHNASTLVPLGREARCDDQGDSS